MIRRRRLGPEYLVLHDEGGREEVLAYDLFRVAATSSSPSSAVEAAAAAGGGRFAAAVVVPVAVEEAMVVKPGFGCSHCQRMMIAGGKSRSCHCQ